MAFLLLVAMKSILPAARAHSLYAESEIPSLVPQAPSSFSIVCNETHVALNVNQNPAYRLSIIAKERSPSKVFVSGHAFYLQLLATCGILRAICDHYLTS